MIRKDKHRNYETLEHYYIDNFHKTYSSFFNIIKEKELREECLWCNESKRLHHFTDDNEVRESLKTGKVKIYKICNICVAKNNQYSETEITEMILGLLKYRNKL